MPKGQAVLSAQEFVVGWVKGAKSGMTVTEIADSLGMKYGACLARFNSLVEKGVQLPEAKKAPKGRQIGPDLLASLQALVEKANAFDAANPE
jgi:hypothetical protein